MEKPDRIEDAFPISDQNPQPVYPRQAIRRNYQGTVLLHVLVDEKGRPDMILGVARDVTQRARADARVTALEEQIAAAAPKGQLPAAPLNCSSISEPIMKVLAPPSRSGATTC